MRAPASRAGEAVAGRALGGSVAQQRAALCGLNDATAGSSRRDDLAS